jgi:hypothetical protein
MHIIVADYSQLYRFQRFCNYCPTLALLETNRTSQCNGSLTAKPLLYLLETIDTHRALTCCRPIQSSHSNSKTVVKEAPHGDGKY